MLLDILGHLKTGNNVKGNVVMIFATIYHIYMAILSSKLVFCC